MIEFIVMNLGIIFYLWIFMIAYTTWQDAKKVKRHKKNLKGEKND